MKKALLFILLSAVAAGCHKSDVAPGLQTEDDRVTVGFSFSGVRAEAVPASRADESVDAEEELAVGTTVRVLAFQRAQGAVAADIKSDRYMAEATYVVEEITGDDGSARRVLTPCNVDAATGAVDGANSAAPAEIRLRADKYDFYALTPAMAVASPWEVSIKHGVDYAASLTGEIAVGPAYVDATTLKQPVRLTMLDRKCSQISFSVDRQSENVTKVLIKSVSLTKIAHEPAVATLCEALPLTVNDGSFTLGSSVFTAVDGSTYKFAGREEFLPKSEGKFGLSMVVEFNDSGEDTELTAPVELMPEWAFEPDKQYCFVLILKGGAFVLTLEVLPWDADWESNLDNIGGSPHYPIIIGQWDVDYWSESTLGAGIYPVLKSDAWDGNTDLDMSIGKY